MTEADGGPGPGELLLWMAVFVVVGAPLFYLVWRLLNELLTGRVDGGTAAAGAAGLAGLAVVLALVARRVRAWEARRVD